ncbi:OsmC family protein [Sinomonas sp. JGH33]|uniref:OsmC family protein n=1 Tax=Sinomonas terricola TaxID=3110330 RepID=A0ABU5T1R8_9MICC|nr:OsmC family protein [Sinomonas sp. JGH33]MEA5453613.1 OsmC family protein [Sinomonas sp. JGH33]
MDFAASIATASPDDARIPVPTADLLIQHHKTRAARVSVGVPTGGHMLHLAVATCLFNDLHTAAARAGLSLGPVAVRAAGGFDETLTSSTGIVLEVEVTGDADPEELRTLVLETFEVSTVASILRESTSVEITHITARTTTASGSP